MKVSITLSIIGVIVAEFVSSQRGLGYLIMFANGELDTVMMMTAIAVLKAPARPRTLWRHRRACPGRRLLGQRCQWELKICRTATRAFRKDRVQRSGWPDGLARWQTFGATVDL